MPVGKECTEQSMMIMKVSNPPDSGFMDIETYLNLKKFIISRSCFVFTVRLFVRIV